jgi:hypothetical protein
MPVTNGCYSEVAKFSVSSAKQIMVFGRRWLKFDSTLDEFPPRQWFVASDGD